VALILPPGTAHIGARDWIDEHWRWTLR